MDARSATTDYTVHPLLEGRWSPRAFDASPVATDDLRRLFEAARWAPSCFNEQPWRFIVAQRDDAAAFGTMLKCLAEANQVWAKQASALVITAACNGFAHNGKPNPHAWHDVGLAVAQLTVQASDMGLFVHQMAGFDADATRITYAVPETFTPITALAIGRRADASGLPEALREMETGPRARRAQAEFVFSGTFGSALL